MVSNPVTPGSYGARGACTRPVRHYGPVSNSDAGQVPGGPGNADGGPGAPWPRDDHFHDPFGGRWALLFSAAERAAKAADKVRANASERALRQSIARQWRTRARIPVRLLPVGRLTGREPMPAILAGLRLGTATLEGDVATAIDGVVARLTVEHDGLSGDRLACTLRGSSDQTWVPGPVQELRREDLVTSIGRLPTVVEGATWTGWGTDDSLESFSRGPCRGVLVGSSNPDSMKTERSRTWHAWLIGAVAPVGPVSVALRGVAITLTGQEEDPRHAAGFSGRLSDWARSCLPEETAMGLLRALAEELTWRPPILPADLPQLVRADLTWEEPVALKEASEFLLNNLTWLLGLHAGRRVVSAGIWHPERPLGYLPDLGQRLVAPLNRTVDTRVPLARYLGSAAAAWTAADERRRLTLRRAIAIRISKAQTELELSIAISNFGLEMLVEQLFGETDTDDPAEAAAAVSTYGLIKTQKNKIKEALDQAIRDNVSADSDYVRDIVGVKGRLFWRTAKDKIGRMLEHYGITFDQEELGEFIKVRDSIAHGKPAEHDVPAKVKAMLSGQAMLTQSILAELGWPGPTYDERQARLTQRGGEG
jgi:hypothetical protein